MDRKRVTAKDYDEEYFELQFLAFKKMKKWAQTRIKEVLSFAEVSEQDIIADVGCGTGTFTIECAKKGSQAYGLDFSRNGLYIAKRASKEAGISDRVDFIESSAEALAMKENSVNKVICADLVEHLYSSQFEALLTELVRITKIGGTVIIYTPSPSLISKLPAPIKNFGRLIFRIPKLEESELAERGQKYEYLHVHLKSARFLKAKLRENGFQIEKEIHTGTGFSALEKTRIIQDFLGGHTLIKARVTKTMC